MLNIYFKCVPFQELTLNELYQILALRQEVFVVEQNCPFLDADGKDQESWHLMVTNEKGELVAYTRLMPLNSQYEGYASIGRVVTSPRARGLGLGKILMEKSIEQTLRIFGGDSAENLPIKIGAQKHLQHFYQTLGFHEIGEDYIEDGIPHTKMVRE